MRRGLLIATGAMLLLAGCKSSTTTSPASVASPPTTMATVTAAPATSPTTVAGRTSGTLSPDDCLQASEAGLTLTNGGPKLDDSARFLESLKPPSEVIGAIRSLQGSGGIDGDPNGMGDSTVVINWMKAQCGV